MYPYLKEDVLIRFDRENPFIFLKQKEDWQTEALNWPGQLVLSFCNGRNSLPKIIQKIKVHFPDETEEALGQKIKQFLVTARIKELLDFSPEPVNKKIEARGNLTKIFPTAVIIEITRQCNLSCLHCYLGKSADGENFFDFPALKKLLEEIYQKGAYLLQITGGEPFLYSRLFELVELVASRFLQVLIATNGTLISPDLAQKFSVFPNLSFQVSLDGPREIHNIIRADPGAFGKTVSGLTSLLKEGHRVKLAATINTLNIGYMDEIAQLANSLKVKQLEFGISIPIGRAKNLRPLSFEDYRFYYQKVKELAEIYKSKGLLITFYQEENDFRCQLIKDLIFINCAGEVFPCIGLGLPLGNLKKQTLDQILSSEPVQKVICLKAPNPELCGACNYLEFCQGCHLQAVKNSRFLKNCAYSELAKNLGLNFKLGN